MVAFAQTDNFVVHVYDPPISGPREGMPDDQFDVDDDGESDFRYNLYVGRYLICISFYGNWHNGNRNGVRTFPFNEFGSLNTADIDEWQGDITHRYDTPPHTALFALKKVCGNDCYYGWAVVAINRKAEDFPYVSYEVYATAMCTIPNQHITLGQYSMSAPLAIDQFQGGEADLLVLDQDGRINVCAVGNSQLDKVMLADCMGRVVFTRQGINGRTLDIEKGVLGSGIYVVRYSLQNGKSGIKKIYIGNR